MNHVSKSQVVPPLRNTSSYSPVDCVGPLPRTRRGNQYLLTVMCTATRFPEAILLRNIKAPNIVKGLIKFFTLVGLPKSIQSDQYFIHTKTLKAKLIHETRCRFKITSDNSYNYITGYVNELCVNLKTKVLMHKIN